MHSCVHVHIKGMRSKLAWSVILVLMGSPPNLGHAESDVADVTDIPPWWQTSCDHNYTSPELHGLVDTSGVDVGFRKFPVMPETIDDRGRLITFWHVGFQYRAVDQEWNVPWKNVTRVSVRQIGNKKPALVLSVTTFFDHEKTFKVGAIEFGCWREIESLMHCYAPQKIEGSPPKPNFPLHDVNGKVVPETKSPNPYCPKK